MKENPNRKNANSTLQNLRRDFQSMMGKERLNALSLVYIHRDIFFDYDKIIDTYASKLLISFCFFKLLFCCPQLYFRLLLREQAQSSNLNHYCFFVI